MTKAVDIRLRRDALAMVLTHLGASASDVVRTDVSFTQEPFGQPAKCFVMRVDFSVLLGGGYQVFEGILGYKVTAITPVCGRHRVTPRFPLVATHPEQTWEDVQEQERLLRIRLDYDGDMNNDRVS